MAEARNHPLRDGPKASARFPVPPTPAALPDWYPELLDAVTDRVRTGRQRALAAANHADEALLYSSGIGTAVPLTRAAVQAAVADQLADGGTSLDAWSAETDGAEVTVRCTRHVEIAFGWLFLGGEKLERTATASARAPTLP